MVSRKRGRQEMEAEESPTEPSMLQKLRNMWQFASFMQYVYFFGDAVKIDSDFDIEELEAECLRPQPSERLKAIGLALLKYVSSHKGLTPEIFDEYARRQYVAKAPQRNPFGEDEEPEKFDDFDVFTKVRVLHQLSTWTLHNPDRIRDKMDANTDVEQTDWRIEPEGWDAEDRSYFVLDDSRLYRRTDAPLPPPKPKSKAKPKKGKATRGSKRRRVSSSAAASEAEEEEATILKEEEAEDDGFGGMKWELLAITEEDYVAFLDTIKRSRDPNEKALYARIMEKVMPVIQKRAEEQKRKAERMQRELEMMQKLATAKRSGRLAQKLEKQKEIEEAREAERKRQAELEMARKEQEKQRKMEEARESRMMTREQRLKEREMKRILHEEELRRLEEDSKKIEKNEARLSERHLKAEMERRQRELEKLAGEEDWVFDCSVCGVHGENLDDGSHSIACENCNVWQHSACHKIPQEEAERDDFHFICSDCKKRAEEASRPKLPPLKFHRTSPKSTEKNDKALEAPLFTNAQLPAIPPPSLARPLDRVDINNSTTTRPQSPFTAKVMNGPSLSPRGQAQGPPPGLYRSEESYSGMRNGFGMSSPPAMRPHSSGMPASTSMSAGLHSSPPRPSPFPPPSLNGSFSQPPPVPYPPSYGNGHAITNGSVHRPPNYMSPATHNPFINTFERQRPSSAHSNGFPSPTKRPPSASPYQSHPIPYPSALASSPASSFPPSTTRPPPSYSPVKQASSPYLPHSSPVQHRLSSPVQEALAGSEPGFSPEKHDVPRPVSSHSISGTKILPPIEALEPSEAQKEVVRTPPSKKMTSERPSAMNGDVEMA